VPTLPWSSTFSTRVAGISEHDPSQRAVPRWNASLRAPASFSRYAGWRVTAVRVRSVANRVADCFTFHYKIGLERALEAQREARRSKKVSADGRWRHLIACPVNGYRSTRRDDRDVSHPVSAEPAGE
jgi:hypothetical protein